MAFSMRATFSRRSLALVLNSAPRSRAGASFCGLVGLSPALKISSRSFARFRPVQSEELLVHGGEQHAHARRPEHPYDCATHPLATVNS
jgi:hypothetical protein